MLAGSSVQGTFLWPSQLVKDRAKQSKALGTILWSNGSSVLHRHAHGAGSCGHQGTLLVTTLLDSWRVELLHGRNKVAVEGPDLVKGLDGQLLVWPWPRN